MINYNDEFKIRESNPGSHEILNAFIVYQLTYLAKKTTKRVIHKLSYNFI
jgi:hypothetical protein